jgi:protoporphyrinogen/coproporphyrinogen III oxidase
MSQSKRYDVAIIGSGISGLTFAEHCQNQGLDYLVLEKTNSVGGVIQAESYKDHTIPKGPRIFLRSRSEKLMRLADRFDIPYSVIEKKMPRFLVQNSYLEKVGLKTLIKHPRILNVFLKSPKDVEESIGQFFESYCGRKFVDNIIEPIVAGIWAQDPYKLSMDHLMGALKFKNFKSKKKKQKGLIVFPKGLKVLLDQMYQKHRDRILLNSECLGFQKHDDDFLITTARGTYRAEKIVLSCSFLEAIEILEKSGIVIDQELKQAKSASIDVVSFYFSKPLARPFGSGYLIPKKSGMMTRGVLFDADFLGYQDCDLLSCFIQDTEDSNEVALKELKDVLKISQDPEKTFVTRYPSRIFSCSVGLFSKMRLFEERLAFQGIFLAGAYPKVGISDALEKVEIAFESLNRLRDTQLQL